MHIAICDDDVLELTRISSLLNLYKQERHIYLTYKTYNNATEMLADMNQNLYDLLLLDILMPGFTGIEAAKEIRTSNNEVPIVFLTSSPEFALDSYSVKARDYIIKPVSKSKLFSVLDSILEETQEPMNGLSLKTQNGLLRIFFSKLSYVEVMNKQLYFHMTDGSIKNVHGSLSEYENTLLSHNEFLKVHRSFIVNLWYMNELTASGFISNNGDVIPISRLLYSKVRHAYMEHLFEKKED
ncbi:MAG: LytTR family DNA-binding domain-containing protein [Anaerovoracaceae bacterium]